MVREGAGRLKEIAEEVCVPGCGVIVRTAAEGS